jgi:hypothetical protein
VEDERLDVDVSWARLGELASGLGDVDERRVVRFVRAEIRRLMREKKRRQVRVAP